MKKKNSLVIGLSIAVSCACITLLVLFIVFGNPLIPKTERFQGQIGSCDAALLAGNLRSAKRSLIRASRAAEGNMSWLRVLKRARILSQTEGDYAVLLNLSAKAQSSLPGREEFHALSLYAALKSGESALAAEEASKLRSERFKRLREEALISVLSLEEQTEPETLIRIAEATQDNRLALDAALKQASRGKFPEAQKALAIAGPERFPLVSALIAYDNRDFEAARTYLNAVQEGLSPAALLLVSDMYIQTNALLSANVVLADFLNTYPGYSPVAYTNLAFLTESAGFDGDSYLRQGLYRFPDSFELISKLAESMARKKRQKEARQFVLDYIESYPAADLEKRSDAELLFLKIGGTASGRDMEASLWELYHSSGRQRSVGCYFSWYLLGARRYDSLGELLVQAEKAEGESAWIEFFRGLLSYERRDTQASIQHLQKSAAIEERYETLHAIGLVHMDRGENRKAEDSFRKAIEKASFGDARPGSKPARDAAEIQFALAQILLRTGRAEDAIDAIEAGLALSPESTKGRFLKKLESIAK